MKFIAIFLAFILIISLFGCSTRSARSYSEDVDEHGRENTSSSANISFYSKSPEDQLKLAKRTASEGNYEEAGDLFAQIYQETTNDTIIRAEALYQLGKVYGNVLNPNKDNEKAIFHFKKLIREFPESEFKPRAEQSVKEMQDLLEQR